MGFGLFDKQLAKIAAKKVEGYTITLWESFVLWMNKMGWSGTGYAVVGVIYWVKYLSNGSDFNLIIATVVTVLFIKDNIDFFTDLWKGAWHKLFPKDIIIPLIDRTIK